MKKPKLTLVDKAFAAYKARAKDYINAVRYPGRRKLLSVDAADAKGQLNGMTIVELITVVRMADGTGEKVYITVQDKTITLWGEKTVAFPTLDLMS